jgi:peptide/nickel transport system substrate-binding protein
VSEKVFGHRARARLYALLSAMVLAGGTVGIAACGDDDDDDGGDGGAAATGGEITMAQTSQPDYLDPALGYTVNAIEPFFATYLPPYTFPHVEGEPGTEVIPGLADAPVEISEDGLTYTFTFRDGIKYSDGTDLKASDWEHAIKRVLNLESGGSSFFLYIDGATEYVEKGDPEGDISGIETDDKTGEVTITLAEPYAAFEYVLTMWFATPVPSDTPFENLTETPPPSTGPYMITESVPNRQFVLEKNPEYIPIDGVPEGNLDKMTTEIVKDQAKQTQDVINNELDYMQDPPVADLKQQVIEQFGPDGTETQRYEEFTTASTYYMWMNHQIPPFDDPQVREAVNLGLDKPALARLFAGEMQPGCAINPPNVVGHSEELDVTNCPYGNPNEPPDLEAAQALLKEAGADGTKITVWGNNDDPTDKVTAAYADMLNQIGFDAELKIIDGGIYFATIGNAKTANLHTGFANWFLDWPHPLNMWFIFDPDSIQPVNNQNYGNIDDPKIKKELDRLNLETDVDAVAEDWAALDEYTVSPPQSHIAVYGHRKLATFMSDRMNFESAVFHPVMFNDYITFALNEGS